MMKLLNLKAKTSLIHYLSMSLATSYVAIATSPANAQGLFNDAKGNATKTFNDVGGGVDLNPVVNLIFGAIYLFLFLAAVVVGFRTYQEVSQGGMEGANWGPIIFQFIAFAILIVFLVFVQKTVFGGA
jgi:hypothetical protein